jgi:hypothetical protein
MSIYRALAAINLYSLLAADFIVRYLGGRPVRVPTGNLDIVRPAIDRRKSNGSVPLSPFRGQFSGKLKLMVVGLCISTLFTYMRSIYRTIEVSGLDMNQLR